MSDWVFFDFPKRERPDRYRLGYEAYLEILHGFNIQAHIQKAEEPSPAQEVPRVQRSQLLRTRVSAKVRRLCVLTAESVSALKLLTGWLTD